MLKSILNIFAVSPLWIITNL